MKRQRSIPAVLVSTVLMIAASTTQSGAAPLADIIASPPRDATISVTPASGQVAVNEIVSISVDFPTSGTGYSNYPLLTLQADGGTGTFADVAGQVSKKSSSSGKYTFKYPVPVTERLRVVADGTLTYATVTSPVKQLTVVPSSAVLDPIVGSGKTATATFTPVSKDKKTELQLLTIETKETDETPLPQWETIATSKQDSNGKTTFTVSDPREVTHQYRAVSGATSPEVEFAAPLSTKDTGLATVYFNSNEGDSVNTRSRYFEGEFSMTGSSLIPACQAVAPIVKSTMKGRGNYSWSFAKKSFTLKIDKKKDLCGMGESKKWALVANHYDKSLLRTSVAFNIGKVLDNMAFTPEGTPVDLYVNGSYRGNYLLVERISIEENHVNIDELKDEGQATDPNHANNLPPNITGGYLLEWDFRKGADKNIHAGDRGSVGIKDPEYDLDDAGNKTNEGISPQQLDYINDYVDAADRALFGGNFTSDTSGWQKYIDIDSAVDYYIGMELMKPVDGNMWASVYMYKPRGDKLYFGPMWDFDLAAGSANRAGNTVSPSGWYLRNPLNVSARQSTKTWFNRLNEDSEFRDAVRDRWNDVYPQLSQSSFIDDQQDLIRESANENFTKWSVTKRDSTAQVVKGSWSKEISYLRSWMSSRRGWMNGQY